MQTPDGGRPSWGNYYARLEPQPDTETFGRDGFYIHGGNEPGSAGCIDLHDYNDDFFDRLRGQRGDMSVIVDYSGNEEALRERVHEYWQEYNQLYGGMTIAP